MRYYCRQDQYESSANVVVLLFEVSITTVTVIVLCIMYYHKDTYILSKIDGLNIKFTTSGRYIVMVIPIVLPLFARHNIIVH